jgi:hypothetical protein
VPLDPFGIATPAGRRTWRQLLLGIERELVLARAWRGMMASDLPDYLFARSSGHFASLRPRQVSCLPYVRPVSLIPGPSAGGSRLWRAAVAGAGR